MKDTHHIESVKIKNFRCFESLEIDSLKRVNLVGGDNNVGKSAFLEAIEIIAKTKDPFSLVLSIRDSLDRRQYYSVRFSEFDIIHYEKADMSFVTNLSKIEFKIRYLEEAHQATLFEEFDEGVEIKKNHTLNSMQVINLKE